MVGESWTIKDVLDLCWQLVARRFLFPKYEYLPTTTTISKHDNNSLTILTYNVEWTTSVHQESKRSQKILQAIRESQADIICLQETNQEWETLLRQKLLTDDNQYPYVCFHHSTTKQRAGGSAILSKFPIINRDILDTTETIQGSVFCQLVAKIEYDVGQTVTIANLHLRPPLNLDGTATLGTARQTNPIRRAELQYIVRQQETLDFLVGDFNQEGSISMDALSNNCYANAVDEFVPYWKETHQWPFPLTKWLTMYKRLDHIFYQPNEWKCVECGVITGYETGASDHQPVLARFTTTKI